MGREITNRIQKARKDAKVKIDDSIVLILDIPEEAKELKEFFAK